MSNPIILDVNGVNQWFGDNKVLHDINLQVVQGQFVGMVGASGCGKSTLLKAILGTDPPKAGTIITGDVEVSGPNRHVGIVYQKYNLYPFLTAEENVAFGLMLDESTPIERIVMPWKYWPKRKRHLEEARAFLHKLKLGKACSRYPSELSGGMAQRVAIAQALIMRPKILLLDEPFGALDAVTREELQTLLKWLYVENLEAKQKGETPPWTIVFITHELDEAFYISDRVIALSRNWYEDRVGGRVFGQDLGATKVWDKASPVYHPDAPKNFEVFHEQKTALRIAALLDKTPPVERSAHVTFWDDLSQGVGTGVAITRNSINESSSN